MKFLLPIFILMALEISGQCQYETNDIDPFEKVERVETKRVRVYWPTMSGASIYFSLSKIDTSLYVKLSIYNVSDAFCISQGHELIVLADDKSVTRFTKAFGTSCTEIGRSGFEGIFYFKASCKSDLEVLSKKKMHQFRIHTGDGYFDWDVQKGNSAKNNALDFFIEAFPCILN